VQRHLLTLALVLGSACAGQSAASLPEAPLIPPGLGQANTCAESNGSPTESVISAAELKRTRAPNLYDAIRRLRPAYLSGRGPQSIYHEPESLVVIVNRHVVGGVDELRSMEATGLVCVRRLPAAEVSLLTGTLGMAAGIELIY
jgi:hypothetical protein